ncbi:hypothetical protein ABT300_34165 [Streptomyces sp. NPDC001027]|uniref:endonuclease/exonuclease/phosphatase family protein n=1 Tax=Streptomyces sp. NPDC001027 TaxID=3154771 RepID=UPI003318D0D2
MPVLALGMLAGLFMSLSAPPQHAEAAVQDHINATYNMQGGGGKWTTDIPQIARRNNVIALQEVGPRPPGQLTWTSGYLQGSNQWNGWRVQQYRWRPLGQSRDWYIYFVRTDFSGQAGANGGRVNIAILTRDQPSAVHIARPGIYNRNGLPASRPALGITLGNTLYFSLHALSPGGNDGAQLVENIAAIAGNQRTWAAMGDFNREPGNLQIRRGWHKYTVGGATHQGGHELDYMVSNERIPAYRGWSRGYGSDHWSVEFRPLAANADVDLLNTHDGFRHLTFASTINGTRLISGDGNITSLSSMQFRPAGNGLYSIFASGTGKCWSDSGGAIIQWTCNGRPDQLFDLRYWGDTGQIQIRPSTRNTCVGDDNDDGWGSLILTTVSCNAGETRLNHHYDQDPGGHPLVVF